ncbi:MAG: hypothetical protein ABL982_16000 [Vicinamibacterales bacterium]
MTRVARAFVGVVLTVVAIAPAQLRADTVQLSLRDGRLSLVAVNHTAAQIFEAWSRIGGVRVVNAERMPTTPLTLTLEDIPEEQALDTVLRGVSGYMARRRPSPAPGTSVFDCIIIVPALAGARPPTAPAPVPAAAPGRAAPAAPPTTFPQGPGVGRLIGPDGQPMEDDQADAPASPFNGGDAPVPDGRPPAGQPRVVPSSPQPAQQATPAPGTSQPGVSSGRGVPPSGATSAPAGVSRPGMPVPAPAAPQQPRR